MKISGRVWPLVAAVLTVTCGDRDTAVPVATPTVTLESAEVSIGSPVDVTYRFAVAPDAAPFRDDYLAFVHFLDDSRELLWTDDHEPVPPTSSWKAGSQVEYTRTMFVPKLPHVGDVLVEMGLYSRETGERLPLAGATEGLRAYHVATFTMRVEPGQTFVVFKSGWHSTEVATTGGSEWQWSRRDAVLAFRNPKQDATLLLELDQPVAALGGPQQVEVRLGSHVVDAFMLPAGSPLLRRVELSASSLGEAEVVEVGLSVDKAFIPANIHALKSTDPRELGVRVFHAYVQPKRSRSGLN